MLPGGWGEVRKREEKGRRQRARREAGMGWGEEKLGSRLYRQDGEVGEPVCNLGQLEEAEPWKLQPFPPPPADASALVL